MLPEVHDKAPSASCVQREPDECATRLGIAGGRDTQSNDHFCNKKKIIMNKKEREMEKYSFQLQFFFNTA